MKWQAHNHSPNKGEGKYGHCPERVIGECMIKFYESELKRAYHLGRTDEFEDLRKRGLLKGFII